MSLKSLRHSCALRSSATASLADPVEDFYKGKQIRFVIRAAPGGNYDLYMRLLARYMVRYMPGHPEGMPVNMPGGGGLTSLNYTINVAPHDGTVLTMVTSTAPMDQALGYCQDAEHRSAVAPVDRQHERRKLFPRNKPRIRNQNA